MDDPPYLNAYEAVRKQQISHKNAIRSIFLTWTLPVPTWFASHKKAIIKGTKIHNM